MKKETAVRLYGHKCFYCKRELNGIKWILDHYYPAAHYKSIPFNRRPSCPQCSLIKADLTPFEFACEISRLFFTCALPTIIFGGQNG